jgi:tetratricopeptide (TPR) repeat protein
MKQTVRAVSRQQLLVSIVIGYASIVVPCSAATLFSAAVEPVVPDATESRAEQQFRKGLSLAQANKLDAAAAIFLRLTQEYPRLLQPYVQLAAVYQQQGKTQGAVEVLRAALKVHTDAARLQEQLGDLYVQLAAQAYRAALDTDHATAAARAKYSTLAALGSGRVER